MILRILQCIEYTKSIEVRLNRVLDRDVPGELGKIVSAIEDWDIKHLGFALGLTQNEFKKALKGGEKSLPYAQR